MSNLDYIIQPKTNGANPFKIFESLEQIDAEHLCFLIRKINYQTFLNTAYWFAVSSVAKSRAGMRCQVCNSINKIQVHHRTYDTHGKEHLNMADLTVLCDNCHGLFHGHKTATYTPPILVAVPDAKTKTKPPIIIPDHPGDLSMPEGDPIILTIALINRLRTNGAFTTATMKGLYPEKTLTTGWVGRLIGTPISRERYLTALKGRFCYAGKQRRRRSLENR